VARRYDRAIQRWIREEAATPARTIAIDGPAASGKSVVGALVAARLRFRFFDTGAMYRAMAWLALHRRINIEDGDALAAMAESASVNVKAAPEGSTEPTIVVLDGADATPHLRDPEVEAAVSLVSRVPRVRAALVRIQRELAREGGVVMAGRDIGTVVLPDAGVKVYLDASRDVRARRRAAQMRRPHGDAPEIDAIVADLARRDGLDSTRAASPLTAAADAMIINTDDLTVEEVVQRVLVLAAG